MEANAAEAQRALGDLVLERPQVRQDPELDSRRGVNVDQIVDRGRGVDRPDLGLRPLSGDRDVRTKRVIAGSRQKWSTSPGAG
ncbi:hypothetical protein Acy02nite_41750 [Actinoplanes cyaneus]|uniref:Uncharacterized protein n=1 Tax=Actinoplanes cyaneus TaxID=52696 RepID=A0A919II90_9ACTN|nr:hypothetical protein Acy02nite_41750 [Actinoplanes cyaneus]